MSKGSITCIFLLNSVKAAYGQICDVLFGSASFPLSVNPTVLPDGVAEDVSFDISPQAQQGAKELKAAFSKEDMALKKGETIQQLQDRLGAMKNKLAPVSDRLIEGPGTTPASVNVKVYDAQLRIHTLPC